MTRSATTLYTSTVNYSERSTIKSATFSVGGNGVATMKYHPLGPLTRAGDQSTFYNDSTEPDALGNAHRKLHYGSLTDVTTLVYEPGSAILDASITAHGLGSPTPDTIVTTYDLAGSAWTTRKLTYLRDSLGQHLYARKTTNMRYGADLKMMISVTHLDAYDEGTHQTIGIATYEEREEYRYDALGRRIWKRLVRPTTYCPLMDKASGCLSIVERTVWDGDQVLAEVRSDGGETAGSAMECDANCFVSRGTLEGVAVYTLGGGLDHPLAIYRDTYADVIVPVYSWRGRAITGVCVNSSQFCATDFTWPAQTENAQFDDPPVTDPVYGGPVAWGGNIIDTQQDGSGLVYKRNRYYDPTSGRFTQVDPIGLGGGLSAYGFGGGDQVSYTDPFGLCTVADGMKDCNKMIDPSQSASILSAAQAEPDWHYTQGGDKGGAELPLSTKMKFGDCSDFVAAATKGGLDASEWNVSRADKANTTMLATGKAKGFTSIDKVSARPGDVVVSNGHTGIYAYTDKDGNAWGVANNGTPAKKDKDGKTIPGRDGTTGLHNFGKNASFARPIVTQ
jgi:RHS repeat-associated protein